MSHDGAPTTAAHVDHVFASVPESIRLSRKIVRGLAEAWGGGPQIVADIELVASELSTNAVTHGTGSSFRIHVESSAQTFTMSVMSHGTGELPEVRTLTDDDISGRGLRIAQSLSSGLEISRELTEVSVTCRFVRGLNA